MGLRSVVGVRYAMLPLGGFWDGVCHARGSGDPWRPDEDTVLPLCNLGYARGYCDRFPQEDGPDAVRFAILGDDGSSIRLRYTAERDHYPHAHGALELSRPLAGPPIGELLARQAQAYVNSYLRRHD